MDVVIPESVSEIAADLAQRPGIVGVFWGTRRRGHEWTDEQCICVHVRWKRIADELSSAELLPRQIGDFPIDVIEVGAATASALDSTDRVRVSGPGDPRRSAITAVARVGGSTYTLFSAHATLPYGNEGIVRSFRRSTTEQVFVRVDDTVGRSYRGTLHAGVIDEERGCDFAIAEFETDEGEPFHYAAGAETPLRLRRSTLRVGETLRHWSSKRGIAVKGIFQQVGVTPVALLLPDGTTVRYHRVLCVSGRGEPFSEGGDSGSLVVDSQLPRNAVGMVLGGSASQPLSYVLPVHRVFRAIGDLSKLFFEVEQES